MRAQRIVWMSWLAAAAAAVMIIAFAVRSSDEDSPWNASINYAEQSANAVRAYYPEPSRDTFVMENRQMSLVHGLAVKDRKQVIGLQAAGGKQSLLADTSDAVAVDGSGIRYRASIGSGQGRINIFRMGLYYTEVHLFDLTLAAEPGQEAVAGSELPVKLEKIYHWYPDRLYQELVWHFSGEATISEAYMENAFPLESVSDFRIVDENGAAVEPSRPDGEAVFSPAYAGFRIGREAIVGFVFPRMVGNGKASVSREEERMVVRHYAEVGEGTVGAGDRLRIGSRLVVLDGGGWDELEREALLEREPLPPSAFSVQGEKAEWLGYMPLQGYYAVTVDHSNFNEAFYQLPHKHPAVQVELRNDARLRQLYMQVRTKEPSGAVEGAAVLDERGVLLPIAVEVAKNFQGEQEEAFYYPGDTAFSESYFPLSLAPEQQVQFTALHAYQNWGQYPLKQISSVRFTNPYYHLSTGVTETNCWVPFYVNGRRDGGWILPDFRTRSGDIWPTQPQFDSVGKNYMFTYNEPDGKLIVSENRSVTLHSVGMTHSDLTMEFVTDDGKANVSIRSVELPQTDENRTYVTMDITFNDTLYISEPTRNLSFFRTEGRNQTFAKLAWIGADQTPAEHPMLDTPYFVAPLGTERPYWTLYDFAEEGKPTKGTNIGLLLLESRLVINGREEHGGLAVAAERSGYASTGYVTGARLTLDRQEVTFYQGDSIRLRFILLPWGTYRDTDDGPMRALRAEAEHRLAETVAGKAVRDNWIPTVRAVNGTAEFTLAGGANHIAFAVEGFRSYDPPVVYKWADGLWHLQQRAVNGYDGYRVYVDSSGRYGFSFVDETDGGPVRYRVVQDRE